jgi:hypothetical protein
MVKPSDPNLDQEIQTDSALSYKMCLRVFGVVINSSEPLKKTRSAGPRHPSLRARDGLRQFRAEHALKFASDTRNCEGASR